MKFKAGQLVNRVVYSKPGKRELHISIVLRGGATSHMISNAELYEVYDIVDKVAHITADWSLEAQGGV